MPAKRRDVVGGSIKAGVTLVSIERIETTMVLKTVGNTLMADEYSNQIKGRECIIKVFNGVRKHTPIFLRLQVCILVLLQNEQID